MNCPIHQNEEMQKSVFQGVEVDYCPKCLGLWFGKDELRQAKDEKLPDLNWLDIDLWQDKTKFRVSKGEMLCPKCEVPMYVVKYGDSDISVDVCNLCQGVFLDRGEFKKVADYLEQKGKKELVEHYWQNLVKEGIEIFTGPESLKEEIADFLAVLGLLNAKFVSQHPTISQIILSLPK